jgi:ribonuclease P protein component
MNFKFGKPNKLKSRSTIDLLFKEGKSITVFPLKLVYLNLGSAPKGTLQVGVSVSKRHHKTAVARNRIKRLMREAFRLNRPHYFNNSSTPCALMILYISKKGTTFEELNTAMVKLLQTYNDKTSQNET